MCCISYCLHRRLRDADGSCNTMFVGATEDSLPESLQERGNRRGVLRERSNREYRGTSRVSWESIPSLPCPLLTLHHDSSQDPVDSRLVTRTFGLEPVDHFGIHAQRDPPLAWTVPARFCAPLLFRQKQQVVLNRCLQLDNFPGPRPRLSPLCFLGPSCHDTIVYPLSS
jgi:hypothetical protein